MARRLTASWLLLVLFVCPLACAEEAPDRPSRTPDVVYVPTPHDVVAKMLQMADVKKEDVVYDLGCGDGRIVATAAKKFGCKAVGFDINPVRVKESKETAEKYGVEDLVQIKQTDIFTLDLSKATVITSYLLPEMNTKLIPQFKEMKPGSRIVAHNYDIDGVTPDKRISMISNEDADSHTIYLYTTPLKVKE